MRRFALCAVAIVWEIASTGALWAQQSNHRGVKSQDQDLAGVSEYWTEDRMRSAEPTPFPNPPPVAQKSSEKPGGPPLVVLEPSRGMAKLHPKRARNAQPVADPSVTIASPNGKLFYVNGGKNWVCSAAAVHRELIVTAAHCGYHRDTKAYSTNVLFVQQYSPTSAGRRFVVSEIIVPGDWLDSGYGYTDQALMRVQGSFAEHYGVVLRPNPSWVLPGGQFGYPAERPFPGNRMYFVFPVEPGSPDPNDLLTASIYSDMTKGSSGGPWVGNNPQGQLGYVFGLNSYKKSGDSARMYSPYFDFLMGALIKCALTKQCS